MKTTFPFLLRTLQAVFMASLLFQNLAYSQTITTDYDYGAFRFPDIDRKALDAQFNLLGNAQTLEQRQLSTPTDNRQSAIFNSLNLTYSRFRNQETLQSQESFTFAEAFSSSRIKSNTSLNRRTNWELGLSASSIYRKYYQPLRFWEYNLFLSTGFQSSKQRNEPPFFTNKSWAFNLNARLPLKVGRGRIEPIDDVFIAKFMMDDLLENGILAAPLSHEQLFSLGQVMAAARNQRIFDFRRQRIYELTQLDNWFKDNGLAEAKSDMLYFTTVADNWLYSFRNVRSAGERYAVGVEPFARFNHFRGINPGLSRGYFGAAAFGEYTHARPINQFWQADQSVRAGIEYLINPADPENDLYNQWLRPFAEAGLGYGYFPNSRTIVEADATLRYEYYHASPDNAFLFDYHVIRPVINLETTYFINYQFRINASLSGEYFWSSDNDRGPIFPSFELPFSTNSGNSGFNLSGNVSLLYSLF